MKIAEGLELIKSLGKEKARLEEMAKQEGWEYRSIKPDSKMVAMFDLNANHEAVMLLDKKMRRLGRAINRANNSVNLEGLNEADYAEWL